MAMMCSSASHITLIIEFMPLNEPLIFCDFVSPQLILQRYTCKQERYIGLYSIARLSFINSNQIQSIAIDMEFMTPESRGDYGEELSKLKVERLPLDR